MKLTSRLWVAVPACSSKMNRHTRAQSKPKNVKIDWVMGRIWGEQYMTYLCSSCPFIILFVAGCICMFVQDEQACTRIKQTQECKIQVSSGQAIEDTIFDIPEYCHHTSKIIWRGLHLQVHPIRTGARTQKTNPYLSTVTILVNSFCRGRHLRVCPRLRCIQKCENRLSVGHVMKITTFDIPVQCMCSYNFVLMLLHLRVCPRRTGVCTVQTHLDTWKSIEYWPCYESNNIWHTCRLLLLSQVGLRNVVWVPSFLCSSKMNSRACGSNAGRNVKNDEQLGNLWI